MTNFFSNLFCHFQLVTVTALSYEMRYYFENQSLVFFKSAFLTCGNSLFLCFIDYSKVFDMVSHNELWRIMASMGYPTHIIELIKQLYSQQKVAAITSLGLTDGELCRSQVKPDETLVEARSDSVRERVAELRRLTCRPKVRTAKVRIPCWTVWSLSATLARVDQSHVRKIW